MSNPLVRFTVKKGFRDSGSLLLFIYDVFVRTGPAASSCKLQARCCCMILSTDSTREIIRWFFPQIHRPTRTSLHQRTPRLSRLARIARPAPPPVRPPHLLHITMAKFSPLPLVHNTPLRTAIRSHENLEDV